jgi:hypothetical protein
MDKAKPLKRYGLLISVILVWVILNFNPQGLFKLQSRHWGWIFSVLATLIIISLMRIRNPKDWNIRLGIHFTKSDVVIFLLSTLLLLIPAYFLVEYLAQKNGYTYSILIFYYLKTSGSNFPFHFVIAVYLYLIFQSLNDEMVVGALLLMGLERFFTKLNQNYIAVLVALVFSVMHQAMYQWNPFITRSGLTLTTIVGLFFAGIIRNVLILKTRKIFLSWAVHLSFNYIFITSVILDPKTNLGPSEPELFNIVFGNHTMLFLTGICAGAALIWLNSNWLTK